jgi:Holliday junction resolvasome RuvABC endonuclease subunit
MKKYFLFTVGRVYQVKQISLSGKGFADDEEVETEVRKWLRQQSKDFNAAGFDALVCQCWGKICRISHGLRFISICDLFTGSPS